MVLESFTNTPHKTIHVLYFEDEMVKMDEPVEFTVGRDNHVDVRITDISVSRVHSKINFFDNNFYISDSNSKFGTLALLQAPMSISYNSKEAITLQHGKYLITLAPNILSSKI